MVLRIQQIAFVTENTLTPCVQADSARVTLAIMSTRQWEKEELFKCSRLREVSLSLSLSSETVNREGKNCWVKYSRTSRAQDFALRTMEKAKEGLLYVTVALAQGLRWWLKLTRWDFCSSPLLGIGMVQLENSIKLKSLYSCAWSLGSTERVVVIVKWTRTSYLIKILVRKIWNGI